MEWKITAMRIVFAANVLVAGVVGCVSLFSPQPASRMVFSGTAGPSIPMRVTRAFRVSIALVSVLGAMSPLRWSGVLVVQLLYKGLWLLVVALPLVIPWSHLAGAN